MEDTTKVYLMAIPCLTLATIAFIAEVAWVYGPTEFEVTIKAEMDNNTLEAVQSLNASGNVRVVKIWQGNDTEGSWQECYIERQEVERGKDYELIAWADGSFCDLRQQ